MTATPLSPTQVKLEWGPVPAIDRNGIITHYEVLFNQTTIDTLSMSGVNKNNSELSATVHPLQPFIPYNISVRAYTRIGPGPLNPNPVTTMTNPLGKGLNFFFHSNFRNDLSLLLCFGHTLCFFSIVSTQLPLSSVNILSLYTGLSLSIIDNDLVVKEGDDISITCLPSSSEVGLEWEIPLSAASDGTLVENEEPLRHTLTIRNANINHEGNYTCQVVGDEDGVIPTVAAFVKVRESKDCFIYYILSQYMLSDSTATA